MTHPSSSGGYWQGSTLLAGQSLRGPDQHFFYALGCLSLQSLNCCRSSWAENLIRDLIRDKKSQIKNDEAYGQVPMEKNQFHNVQSRQEVLWLAQSFLNTPVFDWQWP